MVTSPQDASVISETILPPKAQPLSLTCRASGAVRQSLSPSKLSITGAIAATGGIDWKRCSRRCKASLLDTDCGM